MRYAYCINGFEDFNANIDLACEAEEAGWDGFFLPDGLALVPPHGAMPMFDPWSSWARLPKSMRRALSWDGIIAQRYGDWQPFSADGMRRIHDYVFEQRVDDRPFEIIAGGLSGGGPQAVRPFIEARASWWVEGDMGSLTFDALRERVRRGPPV
jgi:hypothetical protein